MATEVLLLEMMRSVLPLQVESVELPGGKKVGLVVVDEVNGFCTVGCGNLAPPAPNSQISQMVDETEKLCREFRRRGWPILCFLDTHQPDKPEPPYPPHCVVGTGEENLVPALAWLEQEPNALLMRKDCINGYVGAIQKDGSNVVEDWVKCNRVELMLVVGICTDICVMDFVLAALSARNHGILDPVKEVIIYTKGCATYDMPTSAAASAGALPHPQNITHHMGLYFAKSQGAVLANEIVFNDGTAVAA